MTFSQVIKQWYQNNRRDLPWRNTKDPYKIWISEIILQQTRVNQGLPYYYKFIEKYPDIQALATSSIENILKLWQGLGYYSRARNLHNAAKTVVHEQNGRFPDNYQNIRELSGIGDYTAAAIASFAFGLPHPVIDGNVNRLISRYFGVTDAVDSQAGRKLIRDLVHHEFDPQDPALFNQAIMEFGSQQCVPSGPDCNTCPLSPGCKAYADGVVDRIPVKKQKLKVSRRYFNYLVIRHNNTVYLHQRNAADIWAGLFQFPLIETDMPTAAEDLFLTQSWQSIFRAEELVVNHISSEIKHKLSHRELLTRFYEIEIQKELKSENNWKKVDLNKVHEYPVPRLVEKYLEDRMEAYEHENVIP